MSEKSPQKLVNEFLGHSYLYWQLIKCIDPESELGSLYEVLCGNGKEKSVAGIFSYLESSPSPSKIDALKRLTYSIFENAFREADQAQKNGKVPIFSLNVSPLLIDSQLMELLIELSSSNNIPPSQVLLEITERNSLAKVGNGVIVTCRSLTDMGVRLLIDDINPFNPFDNEGYSNLRFLMDSHIPIAGYKLDASVVKQLRNGADPNELYAFQACCAPSDAIVVAEFIETERDAKLVETVATHLQGNAIFI